VDQRIDGVLTRKRPMGLTVTAYLCFLVAALFAANAVVSLATFSTAWHHYGDAYSDLDHDAGGIVITQLTVLFDLLMDVLLAVLAAIAAIRVLRGRILRGHSGRPMAVLLGGLAVLRLGCANVVLVALRQPSDPGDQVAFDLKNAVPVWAQHAAFAVEIAIGVALIAVIILMATPAAKAATPRI
jgi:hypothetical protein